MTERDRKDIKIAISYLKLFAAMNGLEVDPPKGWKRERYQVTARRSELSISDKSALIANIKRLEEMIK